MGGSGSKHNTSSRESTPTHKAQKPTTLMYDPRSPGVDRTPIQVNTTLPHNGEMVDPRSPTAEVPRTPLEGDHPLLSSDIDPRSPSESIDRTPIQLDLEKASSGDSTPTGRPPLSRVNGPRGLIEQKQRSDVEQQISNQ